MLSVLHLDPLKFDKLTQSKLLRDFSLCISGYSVNHDIPYRLNLLLTVVCVDMSVHISL